MNISKKVKSRKFDELKRDLHSSREKAQLILSEQPTYGIEINKKRLKHIFKIKLKESFNACLVFGQYEAGSAICIDKSGIIITCAHCLGDEMFIGTQKTLIFSNGDIILATCVSGIERDVCLLKIEGVYENDVLNIREEYPFVPISSPLPIYNTKCFCIGQPGRDDLESETDVKTNYPFIFISQGKYLGILGESDLNDNFEIGQLIHSCWTYWGHSGAPIINLEEGLIGLHSSWDSTTGTRHGIHLTCIKQCIEDYRLSIY